MLGFEIIIRGKQISAALNDGVVSLIATQISRGQENSIEIDLRGLDISNKREDEMIDWYNAILKDGDEFTVRIKDITENSPPQKIERRLSDIDGKMKSYLHLQEELEKLGLI